MKARNLTWLKRLFSTKKVPSLPLSVYELLQSGIPLQVQKVAGQGRALFATRDLEYGEVLLSEHPYLCAPALSKRKQVCYHCLKVLQTGHAEGNQTVHTRSGTFCSQGCLSAAQGSYFLLESQVNLSQLEQYCEASNERFPLLAARLALMVAQRAMLPQAEALAAAMSGAVDRAGIARFSTGSSSSSSAGVGSPLNTSSWRSNSSSRATSRQASGIGRLSALSAVSSSDFSSGGPSAAGGVQSDPAAPLSFLCFAKVPPPPPAPWRESHKLLIDALLAACNTREDPQEGEALAAALTSLDIDWYVSVMARLHLNTFKVDAVLPLDWGNACAAAAAMLQPDGSSGSALYLLASLFNHSCEPCVNVTFPNNDGTAVFTAARRISAGEQLYISYTDAEQEVDIRQEYLAFAYGFRCNCPKCQEDIAELCKHTPPGLQ